MVEVRVVQQAPQRQAVGVGVELELNGTQEMVREEEGEEEGSILLQVEPTELEVLAVCGAVAVAVAVALLTEALQEVRGREGRESLSLSTQDLILVLLVSGFVRDTILPTLL